MGRSSRPVSYVGGGMVLDFSLVDSSKLLLTRPEKMIDGSMFLVLPKNQSFMHGVMSASMPFGKFFTGGNYVRRQKFHVCRSDDIDTVHLACDPACDASFSQS